MPRKTLALIIGLVLVTIVLFIIALRTGDQQTKNEITQKPVTKPSPTPAAHTTLTLSPNPVDIATGQQGTVDVIIDTSEDNVTAVQLELIYDPLVISNVKIATGDFFPNAVILINKNDIKTGRATYAFGIQPNQKTIKGVGSVATITFIARGSSGVQSHIALLPNTLVTAKGISGSVLKTSSGTVINIITSSAGVVTVPVVATPQVTTAPVQ